MKTMLTLYIANVREFTRNRQALFWTFAFPIMFIVLFGVIFSNNQQPSYNIGIIDADQSSTSQQMAAIFRHTPEFAISTGTSAQMLDNLRHGKLSMVLLIPLGASQAIAQKQPDSIIAYYDPTRNQTDSQIILSIVQQELQGFNESITHVPVLLSVTPQSIQTFPLRNIDFLIPGLLAMALMQLGLFATATPIVSLRQDQVLRRIGATPLPRWQWQVSQVALRMSIAIIQMVLLLGIGKIFFQETIQGNLLAVLGIVLLGASTFVGIGYLIAARANTVESTAGFTQGLSMPMMFLSGLFFPISLLPGFLAPIVNILPLTYLADALRQILISSTPAFPMSTDILVLAGWTIVTGFLAMRLFKWE